MAFIGNTNTTQAFTPAVDYFSGTGSATAFTLSRPVASVAQVQVVIDNVAQNPSSAYTVSSNTITFTSAPLSGTNNIYVYYTSPITQVIAPGQGTVNTTALGNITNIASGNSSLTLQTGSSPTTAVTIDTSQKATFAGAVQTATLNSSTGVLATQNGMTGIAKAWAVWNPVASTLQSGSFNISSYTRNSAGNYTFSFTTSMPNTTYAVSGTFPGAGVTIWVNSPLTGSVQIYAKNYVNGFDDGISGLASIIVFSS
jgi:hypothetical protein